MDPDHDGIVNADDDCPKVAEDFDGVEDDDGCPEADDRDGDGILDAEDNCPDEPEDLDGIEDTDGCPEEPGDTDGDGIVDEIDRCPKVPEDIDGWEDQDGCPDVDNDLDGIVDVEDECRNIKETVNGFEDEDGCPDEAPERVEVTKTRINIRDKIYFEVDRAVIRPESYDLLDEIAAVINAHPELRLIRVEGHTDSDGDDAYNLTLSQQRAKAVVDYLVREKVDRGRLDWAGFGESKPIADNETDIGKQKNRRVEFLIIERDQ